MCKTVLCQVCLYNAKCILCFGFSSSSSSFVSTSCPWLSLSSQENNIGDLLISSEDVVYRLFFVFFLFSVFVSACCFSVININSPLTDPFKAVQYLSIHSDIKYLMTFYRAPKHGFLTEW